MNNTLKYIFLTFVFFSLFFLGSFHLGYLTMRNVATILLFIVALFMPRSNVKLDGVIKTFIVYLVVLFFCNLINGEIISERFIHIAFAFLFPSAVSLFALPKFLRDKKDFLFVIGFVVILYIFNALVSYGQYANNRFAWLISSAIGYETPEKTGRFFLGSFIPGLTGDIVNNGYFLATFVPIAAMGILMKKKVWNIVGYFTLLFSGFCMYVVQQRMAFLCLALFVVFLALVKRDRVLVFSAVVVLFYVGFQGNPLDSINTGRLDQTEDEGRMRLFEYFIEYVQSPDSFFGGINAYVKKYETVQHNSFTSAFVLGGVPTFIVFVVMFFKIVYNLFKTAISSMRSDPIPCSLAVSCLIYVAYGMTHSSGLQNDGLFFWISYAILISYNKYIKKETISSIV